MDPDRSRRRRDDPFGGLFENFDQEFERMRHMMNDVIEGMLKAQSEVKPGQPFVYGFQVRMGPDGRPSINHFGNAKGLAPGGQPDAREPLCDVLAGDDHVSVTMELPGVEKDKIRLHIQEDRVNLEVDSPRAYRKVLELPARVKPSTAKATYKNGILDLTIQRESLGSDSGTRVKIE